MTRSQRGFEIMKEENLHYLIASYGRQTLIDAYELWKLPTDSPERHYRIIAQRLVISPEHVLNCINAGRTLQRMADSLSSV